MSKQVNGTTLYQMVAKEDFDIPTIPEKTTIQKGARGGWVPSLHVLGRAEKKCPWLDEHSHISNVDAYLSGPLWLQNSQWDGPGWFNHELPEAWTLINCQFSGKNEIRQAPQIKFRIFEVARDAYRNGDPQGYRTYFDKWHVLPREYRDSKLHDAVIDGPLRIKNTTLQKSFIIVQGGTGIEDSSLKDSRLRSEGNIPQSLKSVQWSKATIIPDNETYEPCVWQNLHWTNVTGQTPITYLNVQVDADKMYVVKDSSLSNINFNSNNVSGCDIHTALSESGKQYPLYEYNENPRFNRDPWVAVIQPNLHNTAPSLFTTHDGVACPLLIKYRHTASNEEPVPLSIVGVNAEPLSVRDLQKHLDHTPADDPKKPILEWLQTQFSLGVTPINGAFTYVDSSVRPSSRPAENIEHSRASEFAPIEPRP